MYKEYDCFILKKEIPGEYEIQIGQKGVVLMVLGRHSNYSSTYEVEFLDDEGFNLGSQPTFEITEDYMTKI
jgi:hypothetical protein